MGRLRQPLLPRGFVALPPVGICHFVYEVVADKEPELLGLEELVLAVEDPDPEFSAMSMKLFVELLVGKLYYAAEEDLLQQAYTRVVQAILNLTDDLLIHNAAYVVEMLCQAMKIQPATQTLLDRIKVQNIFEYFLLRPN